MQQIPALDPVYLSSNDYRKYADLDNFSDTLSFQARAAYFERCADTLKDISSGEEFSPEEQYLYDSMLRVLDLEDDESVDEFGHEYMEAIVSAVFEQHLLDLEVSPEEFEEIMEFVTETLNTETQPEGEILIHSLINSYIGLEYTASVFAVVSDIIDIANTRVARRGVMLN